MDIRPKTEIFRKRELLHSCPDLVKTKNIFKISQVIIEFHRCFVRKLIYYLISILNDENIIFMFPNIWLNKYIHN